MNETKMKGSKEEDKRDESRKSKREGRTEGRKKGRIPQIHSLFTEFD